MSRNIGIDAMLEQVLLFLLDPLAGKMPLTSAFRPGRRVTRAHPAAYSGDTLTAPGA
jgi:hypothetical protein